MVSQINLSASIIKTLSDCSLKVFYNKVLKLPEVAHWKTRTGSAVHDVLELLAKERHYNLTNQAGTLGIRAIPALNRLVQKKIKEYELDEYDVIVYDDIDKMIKRAVNYNFQPNDCVVHPPELKFQFQVNGYSIKGFLDRVLEYDNYVVVRDYKSQAKPFTKEELQNNLQAKIYQYAIKQMFNKRADIEFIMLRQEKTSINFIQRVPWVGEDVLEGLELYLVEIGRYLSQFDLNKAISNPAATSDKAWQCKFCSYKNSFICYGLYNENGELIKTSLKEVIPNKNEIILPIFFEGCLMHKSSI